MDQPLHEHRKAPPPAPQGERVEPRTRRSPGKRAVVVLAMVWVGLLAFPLLFLPRYATVATHHSAVGTLRGASVEIRNELLDGASLEAAIESAHADVLVGPDARWALLVSPDRDAWLGVDLDTGPGPMPVVLIVDRVFDDCFLAPGGEGRRGYYGITATLDVRSIPEGELPQWARP